MENYSLTPIEKEMLNFNELHMQKEEAKKNIAGATSASDVTSEICNVWKKTGSFVKLAEEIPVVGKLIKNLSNLLDSLSTLAAFIPYSKRTALGNFQNVKS